MLTWVSSAKGRRNYDVLFEFSFLYAHRRQCSKNKLTFVVGLTCQQDSVRKELRQRHKSVWQGKG